MPKPFKTKYPLFNPVKHSQRWQAIKAQHEVLSFYLSLAKQCPKSLEGEGKQDKIQAILLIVAEETDCIAEG